MDQSPTGLTASTSSANSATTATRSRPSARRTPSELSALSKSILSLHDDLEQSQDSLRSDGGSDRSRKGRRRNKRDKTKGAERRIDQNPTERTSLLSPSTRNSSFSFSHQTVNYSDSYEDTSPLLYSGSFIDHQPLQRQAQQQLHQSMLSQRQMDPERVFEESQTPTQLTFSSNFFNTVKPEKSGSPPSCLSPSGEPSATTTRSHSFSSQLSRTQSSQFNQPKHSNESSPKSSSHSSISGVNREHTDDTLIMPQISSFDTGTHTSTLEQDARRKSQSAQSLSPSITETTGALPRMMSPSPVPLHARLSRIQKEARRGARVIDMENQGVSHHYDYEEVTDSSYDFSSRRHSVAEEDVCYPLQSMDTEIDFVALEEYIRQEQARTQKMMMNSKLVNVKPQRGSQSRQKSVSGGLLSKLKGSSYTGSTPLNSKANQEQDYGTITAKSPINSPERSYSLFGERDKSQIPLDDAYRFTLYSTASVTVHAQTLGEIPPRGQTLSKMLQAGCFWLDVLAPTDEEIRMLSQVFKIHPLTTEDILMEEGREKCEMFLNYYFVCFRTFVLDPNSHNYLQPLSIYNLVFPGGIISYHFRPVPHCRNVRKRIRHLKERMEVTADWINYAIVDDIVDSFAPLIRQVETEVDMIDELVLILKESEQSDMLRRIGNCRKRVMSLLRLLTGKSDVIKGLIKRYEGRMGGAKGVSEIGLFIGDIQDHIVTMLQNLSHYEKILSRSHSNYLAQINIEMTSASNETNDVLTKLTVLGSILLPMNLVTGLWGMNVPVPGQETEGLAWFFWIVTAIFCAAFLFLLIARKTRLL